MSLSHPSRDSQGRKERMSKERQEQAGVTRKLPRSGLVQLLFIRIPNIVRRAKLGVVSQGKNLAPEALAGHRVPSVASSSVTLAAKRTQGGDGLQCASVKGLSPVMDTQLWMPTWLCSRKAISREPSRPWLRRIHRGRRPWHVIKAASGTRELLWALPGTGVGWPNRHTGRKPDTPEEVGCLHMSDEVG